MYQNLDESIPATEHLAREWAMFRAGEADTPGPRSAIWHSARPLVVLGRSGRAADHVHLEACRADGVEVVRRESGGGTVVLGPGCLNYAVVLSLVSCPGLIDVAESFRWILGRIVSALDVRGLSVAGGTDLAVDGGKVSGNAQRRGRRALLHHGTLLFDFDPALASRYLKEPARQPAYRASRRHAAFMANLALPPETLRARLADGLAGLVRG